MARNLQLSFHEGLVDQKLRRDVGKLGIAPALNGLNHRLEIPLHGIDADGERILQREILAVFGEDRLEVALECHVLANKDLVADRDTKPKTLVVGVADTERETGSVHTLVEDHEAEYLCPGTV